MLLTVPLSQKGKITMDLTKIHKEIPEWFEQSKFEFGDVSPAYLYASVGDLYADYVDYHQKLDRHPLTMRMFLKDLRYYYPHLGDVRSRGQRVEGIIGPEAHRTPLKTPETVKDALEYLERLLGPQNGAQSFQTLIRDHSDRIPTKDLLIWKEIAMMLDEKKKAQTNQTEESNV